MNSNTKIDIRFSDIDVAGHVHNSKYLCYFELGRIDFLSKLSGENWNWRKKGLILGRNEVDYLVPIYLKDKKEIEVNLKPGDMLFYYGCELEHWRNKFKGSNCTQVFLHYNRLTKNNKQNIYDGRPMIGLPAEFKK